MTISFVPFCSSIIRGFQNLRDVQQEREGTSFNYFKYFLTILNNFIGLPWSILVYLGLFLTILVYLGASRCISVNFGLSLSISAYLGLSWSISVYLCLSLSISVYLSLSRTISGYLSLSWIIFDYFWLSGKGIYCPIIRKRGRGGIKPVPLEYFGEENLYLKKFSLLLGKNLAFFEFFEKIIA